MATLRYTFHDDLDNIYYLRPPWSNSKTLRVEERAGPPLTPLTFKPPGPNVT